MSSQKFNIQVPKKLLPVYATKKRYIVLYGGRGSGKSIGVADYLILRGYKQKERILCTREIQNSIAQSVHKLLCDRISALRLSSFYTITEKAITGKNGTEFFFRGLYQNESSIKSFQGITLCWGEESQAISRKSIEVLLPTIREPNSQIIFTLNPTDADDCVYVDFVLPERKDTLKIQMNYSDNPFFPDVLRAEMEYDRGRDVQKWEHVWQGVPILHSDAQIYKGVWTIQEFTAPEKTHFYYGCDFGFSRDATAGVRCYITGNQLYIDYEVGNVGVEVIHTPALLYGLPDIKTALVYGDCSRPETISHCKAHGLPGMRPCDKWKGCVEDRIQFIRGFDIIVHPRCKQLIQEFRLYQYEVDKNSGQVTNRVKDANNHWLDALAYSLNDVIKKRGTVQAVQAFY